VCCEGDETWTALAERLAWAGAGVEPLKPIVETSPAEQIAAIVRERMRRGVSQPKWWF
jgi:hypothetical protein